MRNKKACAAVLGASALVVIGLFILGGCGGSDLIVPPRESFFTPIYTPSGGGTFADPLDLDIGEVFKFVYVDDDYDGLTGEEDEWRDTDGVLEGRVVLKKHRQDDQYVVILVTTQPSPIPYDYITPAPSRFCIWATGRALEFIDVPLQSPKQASASAPLMTAVATAGETRGDGVPPVPAWRKQFPNWEEQERRMRVWGELERYMMEMHTGPKDLAKIEEITGVDVEEELRSKAIAKAGPLMQPIPEPTPLARNLTPQQLRSLTVGNTVYFTFLTGDFFLETQVLAVSDNSIIFGDVDPLGWLLLFESGLYPYPTYQYDPDDFDWIQDQIDSFVVPRLRLFYGSSDAPEYDVYGNLVSPGIGDVDKDGRITILVSPWVYLLGAYGFLDPYALLKHEYDLNPDSNQMNMVYMAPPMEEALIPVVPEVFVEVVAHEYLHLLHFIEKTYRRMVQRYGPVLITRQQFLNAIYDGTATMMRGWVTEGMAVLAEDITGYNSIDFGASPAARAYDWLVTDNGIIATSLTDDYTYYVYGRGYVFYRYLMEQCGGMTHGITWIDDVDGDFIAERIGFAEHGIDFLRYLAQRKETSLELVDNAMALYDKEGGRRYPDYYLDFLAMCTLDNAKNNRGVPLNTSRKYNLNRDAVWVGGIDLTTLNHSGMRTHESRVFRLYPGMPVEVLFDGMALGDIGRDGFNYTFTATDAGGAFGFSYSIDSPEMIALHFEPYYEYQFTGEYGTQYDSMEFFFASNARSQGATIIIRTEDLEPVPGQVAP